MGSLGTKERGKLLRALNVSTEASEPNSKLAVPIESRAQNLVRPLWVLEFDPLAAGKLTGGEGRHGFKQQKEAEGSKMSSSSNSQTLRLQLMHDSLIDSLMRATSDWAAMLTSQAGTHGLALAPACYAEFVEGRVKRMSSQVMGFSPVLQTEHISFDLDAVPLASKPLEEVPFEKTVHGKCLCVSSECKLVRPRHVGTFETYTEHPLLSAVHYAFAQHRPLVLYPDALWLTVAQGVALHVRNNAEALREKLGLVGDRGSKRQLRIAALPFERDNPEAWQEIVEGFAWTAEEQTAELSKLRELLTCDFSTTGPEERCASAAVFLEGMKNYFDYECGEICGIPCITLEGSEADWQSLLGRVDQLDAMKLGLDFWTGHLRVIFEQFVNAAKGVPDIPFWRRIYKIREMYGEVGFTGWVGCLFPYRRDCFGAMTFTTKNGALRYSIALHGLGAKVEQACFGDSDEEHGDFESAVDTSGAVIGKAPKLDNEDFPSGVSCFDFGLRSVDGSLTVCQFLAGFFGLEQGRGPDSLALRPRIAWAVVHVTGITEQLQRLASDPRHRATLSTETRKMQMEWPKDLRAFYGEFERCALHCSESGAAAGATFIWPEPVFTVDVTGFRNDWFKVAILPGDSGMLLVANGIEGSAKPEFFHAMKVLKSDHNSTAEEHLDKIEDEKGGEKEEEEGDENHDTPEDEENIRVRVWGLPERCRDCYKHSKGFTMSIWSRWQPSPDHSHFCLNCWKRNWLSQADAVAKETQLIEEFAGFAPPRCIARSFGRLLEGLCAMAVPYFFEAGWELEPSAEEDEEEDMAEEDEEEDMANSLEGGRRERPKEPLKQEPCMMCDTVDVPGWHFGDYRFVCEACLVKDPPERWVRHEEKDNEF